MIFRKWLLPVMASALMATTGIASAQTATIAVATTPSAMDPHFHTTPANYTVNIHVFQPLVMRDPASNPTVPVLAESWEVIDEETWEFRLRQGVTFHDGTPLTADDVAFTFERAPDVPNSPGSFAAYLKLVESVEIVDDHTLRIKTPGPAPELLSDLANILIISRAHGEDATTDDYNSGRAVIGTGPYKFVRWSQGDQVVYERNPDYWGEAEPWEEVVFRVIPNGAARVAALLAGDVDLISDIPTQDVEQLRGAGNVSVWSGPSSRIVFIALNTSEEALATGDIVAPDGSRLDENPLADPRVREALRLAIDLDIIRDRVNSGEAVTAGQYVSEGVFGYIPDVGPWSADLDRARALIEESGWGGRFKLTLTTSSDRINNSVRMVQVIAQAWTRIGVETEVETMPFQVFSSNRLEIPVSLSSWGNSTGSAAGVLGPALHTQDVAAGFGTSNYFAYSNPEVDELTELGLATMDDAERESLYQEAMRIAIEDNAYIPLFLMMNNWATRQGLSYEPRIDAQTNALGLRPE